MSSRINADSIINIPEIEKQWAVRAFDHAEVYLKLLKEVVPSSLRLTKYFAFFLCRIDSELYIDFRKHFPDMEIKCMTLDSINGSELTKEKWRNFIIQYENILAHYNFGTLLRLDALGEYTEENTCFGTSYALTTSYENTVLCH